MAPTPESVIRMWFEELWNNGDESTIDRLMAPDCVVHGLPTPEGGSIHGPAGFKPFYRRFRAAFPNIHITVLDVIASSDVAVAHCQVTGTHSGDALGVPATNRDVTFEGFSRGRFRDGQLTEGWNTYDFMGMYQQLGMRLDLPVGA
jgi:steroid delta-isomerase-like uncharacterized protein